MHQNLTRHPAASIKELWAISSPLMISTLASLLMLFTDRIFLAQYSTDALNASVNAGTFAWALMAGFGVTAAMSEIFVAQYNGAKQYLRLGSPAWQMIWFSLLSILFFTPMALWGVDMIFSEGRYADLEISYCKWLLIFSPSYALLMAFSGFFIGRGKTKMMIWLAIIANCINVVLDWALIYGKFGIPEMGIQGAAIATCFGYFFEAVVLGYLFLKKENRLLYGTSQWKIDWVEMKKCLKVGIPQGLAYTLEILGWAVFYRMMTQFGETHITVASICQSFTILLSFFYDGLSRGASAVAGNFIGAKRLDLVPKVLKSGIYLIGMFSMATALILLLNPVDTASLLLTENPSSALEGVLRTSMCLAFIYLFFEGVRWVFAGVLLASGDTMFLLIAGALSVWCFLLAPLHLFSYYKNLSIEFALSLTVSYALISLVIYWIRFKSGAWKKLNLIDQQDEEGLVVDRKEDTPA